MNKIFSPVISGYPAVGLLIMRVIFGIGMAGHGVQKIRDGVFHWADPIATMPIHLVIPPFFQGLATFCEFFGGLAMIAGLLTPLAMLGVICTLSFALIKFHFPQHENYVGGFGKPDYELAAHYWLIAVGLFFTGPGTLSLDGLIFGRRIGAQIMPP